MTSTQRRGVVPADEPVSSPPIRIESYKMVNNNQKNSIPGNSFTVITLVFCNVFAIKLNPAQLNSCPNEQPFLRSYHYLLVGIGGFHHAVAGSTTMFYLLANNSMSWSSYLTEFFIPTLLGNIIGGVSLVAALGHAQVVGGKK
jgi:hypothetical protein